MFIKNNIISFVIFLLIASQTHAALINGSFENPLVAPGSITFPSTIPGWQTTDSSFEVWGTGALGVPAHDGNQFVELNAFIAGTLSQNVSGIAAGLQVGYDFAHRARANNSETVNVVITDLGIDNTLGGANDTELFNGNFVGNTTSWTVNSGVATSLSLGNDIRFAYSAVRGGSVGNFLDAVSFGTDVGGANPNNPIPEPASTLLFGVGLAGLIGRRYLRKTA